MARNFRARLTVSVDASTATDDRLRDRLRASGLTIVATTVDIEPQHRTYVYEILETRTEAGSKVPTVVDLLAREPGIRGLQWRPLGS